ncbi:MAG: hypothetical protein KF878_05255 [Planctomycetes bacterium]|nr:hypothetical protein [Planctomycetota bacterium]
MTRRFQVACMLVTLAVASSLVVMVARLPTLRSPDTWSAEDLRRVLGSPLYHGCSGNHGHVPGRGLRALCRGSYGDLHRALLRLKSTPETERLLLDLLDAADPEVASRAAEVIGARGVAGAEATLLRHLEALPAPVPAEQRILVLAFAWALERLGAQRAAPILRQRGAAHAPDVLDSLVTCDGCPTPHAK